MDRQTRGRWNLQTPEREQRKAAPTERPFIQRTDSGAVNQPYSGSGSKLLFTAPEVNDAGNLRSQ
jgi:hypothetical protein